MTPLSKTERKQSSKAVTTKHGQESLAVVVQVAQYVQYTKIFLLPPTAAAADQFTRPTVAACIQAPATDTAVDTAAV
eukprot:6433-Heterococcus_DN1.PRE.1